MGLCIVLLQDDGRLWKHTFNSRNDLSQEYRAIHIYCDICTEEMNIEEMSIEVGKDKNLVIEQT